MLLMLEKKAREALLFAQRGLLFCCLNRSSSQALTACLTGAAFEEMENFFSPLLKTKGILRWCRLKLF